MAYERIRYTNHARKRMRRRKIGRTQVKRTLNRPDRTYPSYDKMVAESATAEGNTIMVVYVELSAAEALVVTVVRREGP